MSGKRETPAEFFRDRKDWLDVRLVPVGDDGYDIVLRIDGTYFTSRPSKEMLRYWRRRVKEVADRAEA